MTGTLRIESDEVDTLIDYITSELGDDELDQIEVDREIMPTDGLASEAITAAVVLTCSTTAMVLIARLVEKWMDSSERREVMRLIADVAIKNSDAAAILGQVAGKYADVSIAFGKPEVQNPVS